MRNLIEMYTHILDAVIHLDDLEYKIGELRNKIIQLESEKKKLEGKTFGSGSFGSVVALVIVIIGFICEGFLGAIIAFVVYTIVCVLMDSIIFEKKRKQKIEHIRTVQIAPIQERIAEYEKKIAKAYNSNAITYFETHFPPECQSVEALQFFIEALTYGRAETEKELFNLWADESYRQQMLFMQSEQIRQNQHVLETQHQQAATLDQQTRLLQQQVKQQKKLSRQVRYGNVVSTLDFLKEK